MTASPESVRKAFETTRPLVESVQKYVGTSLRSFCAGRYLFTDRRKTLESLSEKLESGRYQRWSQLDDLYACTVVVPVSSFEEDVLHYLDAAFEQVKVRQRSEIKKAPDVFRFDGLRWYGKIRPEIAETMLPGLSSFIFEVQVLTAFEYAWVRVTHSLVYKSEEVDWKRLRLAAQLKAAVEQIEMIVASFESSSTAVPQSPWPEHDIQTLIISRFKAWIETGLIPDTLTPASWRRFGENVYQVFRQTEGKDSDRYEKLIAPWLENIESELRSSPAPFSGTLFQYVVGVVSRAGKLSKLKKPIVPSSELRDFHGIFDIPKEFEFDLELLQDSPGSDTPAGPGEESKDVPPMG